MIHGFARPYVTPVANRVLADVGADLRTAPDRPGAHDHRGGVAEEALVRADADAGLRDPTFGGLPAQLPHELTYLRERLRRHGFAEAGEPAADIHRQAPTKGGRATAQQRLRTARFTKPQCSYQSSSSDAARS